MGKAEFIEIPRHFEDAVLWLADNVPSIMDDKRVRRGVERVIDKRLMRDYEKRRRHGLPRTTFKWTEEASAELLLCSTRQHRQAFAAKYRVSIAAMRLQRHRLKCNAASGGGEGVG